MYNISKMNKFRNRLKTDKNFRTKTLTSITMMYNFIWSIFKIFIGALRASYVYILSGVYNIFIGSTKQVFVQNHGKVVQEKPLNKEKKSLTMGVLVLIAGVSFAAYMGSLLIYHPNRTVSLTWAIFLAACSFVELGIAICHLVRVKKKRDILLSSLRCTNFVSALFAIVITQVALLSTDNSISYAHIVNAITGMVAGGVAIVVGSIMIANAHKLIKLEEKKIAEKNLDENNEEKS